MDDARLDQAVKILQSHKDEWARLPIERKMNLLLELRANLAKAGQRWVSVSIEAKGIDPASSLVGEEWVAGPWAFAIGINALLDSLEALAKGRPPSPKKVWTRPNGQLVAHVFPANIYDKLLLNDINLEVWMQPGVTEENLPQHTAVFYQQTDPEGRVALILGAGNVNSIPAFDLLHKLYVHGEVGVVKMNPVNEYFGPLLEEIFAPFITAGYAQFVYGGAEVGARLVEHEAVETIHITGSASTYETIVFGAGEEGQRRKRLNEPVLTKPITSELGGVGPVIVVPGPWDAADIRYQAENIVTMKLQNGGYNCVAIQILILPEAWDGSAELLGTVRQLMQELPPRKPFYPGTAGRQRTVVSRHARAEQMAGEVPRTLVTGLDPEAEGECCYLEESFGEVLAQVSLPGDTPSEFLQNAIAFCNGKLHGTLGATIIVHPKTAKRMGPVLEAAVDGLRYGAVGINAWSAGVFLLPQAAWGGYPGASHQDVQSGIGFVHNSFMFEKPQKTVIRGSFYPFPRAWRHGDLHIAPKPVWFVTNKTAHVTSRLVARLVADPGPRYLPRIFISALRG